MKKYITISSIIETLNDNLKNNHSAYESNSINIFNLEHGYGVYDGQELYQGLITNKGFMSIGQIYDCNWDWDNGLDGFSFSYMEKQVDQCEVFTKVYNIYNDDSIDIYYFLDTFDIDDIENEELKSECEQAVQDIKDEYAQDIIENNCRDFGYYGFNNTPINTFINNNIIKDKKNYKEAFKAIILFNYFYNNTFESIKRNIDSFKNDFIELLEEMGEDTENYFSSHFLDDYLDTILSFTCRLDNQLLSILDKYNTMRKIEKLSKLLIDDYSSYYIDDIEKLKQPAKIEKLKNKLDKELKVQPFKKEIKRLKI